MIAVKEYCGQSLEYWLEKYSYAEDECECGDIKYEWVHPELKKQVKRVILSEKEKAILKNPSLLLNMSKKEFTVLLDKLGRSHMHNESSRIAGINRNIHSERGRECKKFDVICLKKLKETSEYHHVDYHYSPNAPYTQGPRKEMFIDGLPTRVWISVFYPEENPDFKISHLIVRLREFGREDLIPFVLERNRERIIMGNKAIVERYNLPEWCIENGGYPLPNKGKFNGIPYGRWRVLNDPSYVPQKTYLVFWINYYEHNGDFDTAEDIRTRFDFLINPSKPKEIITDIQLKAATDHIRRILSREYSNQLIHAYTESMTDDKESDNDVCSG